MRSMTLLFLVPLVTIGCDDSSGGGGAAPPALQSGEVVLLDNSVVPANDGLWVNSTFVNLRDLTLVIESTGVSGTFDIVVDYGGTTAEIAYAEQDLPADLGRLEIPLSIPGNPLTFWKVSFEFEDYEGHIFVSLRGTEPLPLPFPFGNP